ncbi:helix-turn-helix domain-containing protein [Metallosphaera hakonensis]|uniref:Putative HTH-type transcriptional regulatory protein DFR87_10035 n=1 Tax=Metallosphaera hakonensis JCM 8857 = DSM 7519 TaxID=1293036 RepID=A0A2U9IVR6_9CREN|nr:helix-turn-helix domain-containing protein [Metallosphaera hakonensis]AWR99967.1 helix-turn-helix domain-containing protein [Metallosphaera hakonensis JCM 8857 = DSM 7519]
MIPVTLDNVLEVLEREGVSYSLIEYPEKNRKSIDIIARGKQRRFVIKISLDKPSKDETKELRNFSAMTGGMPIVVTDDTEEDIAIGKDNVIGLSVEGLAKALRGEKIFIYRTRGGIFIKIKSEVLRRKRMEMNYSMGDLSKLLGVTRKTIYDYENGESDVSIEVAEKLIDLFGEEVIGDVCDGSIPLLDSNEVQSMDTISSRIAKNLSEAGFTSTAFRFTAVDVVASKGSKKVLITIEPRSQDQLEKKFREASKIANELASQLLIIARSSSSAKKIERDGFKILATENIDSLNNEISGNNRGEG